LSFSPLQRSAKAALDAGAEHVSPAPSDHAAHSFTEIPIFSAAQTRALGGGRSRGAIETVGPARYKDGCSCAGTCPTCRNPNRTGSGPTTQDPDAGPAAAGAAPAPAPAEPGLAAPGPAAPAAPARHAQLARGPRYTPRGSITPTTSGGLKSAGPWDMDAVFASDPANGVFPGCGEVHQDIKWNAAAATSFNTLFGSPVPHSGFPATHPANVWIEDRDTANTRYGRRSGPMSAPVTGGDEYTNSAGVQDMRHGAIYHGNDNPSDWPTALTGRWTFMLLAFDMCNHGVQVGNADFITIDW
jgi:hypothetical protein